MQFDHEKFEKITAGVQSIVTAIGIVVGGIWAYHTFGAVGTVQKAEAELTTLRQTAARQPVLQIAIQTAPIPARSTTVGGRSLEVLVSVKNEGNYSLLFTAPLLEVLKLPGAGEKQSTGVKVVRSKAQFLDPTGDLQEMPERLLVAGQGRTIAFLVDLPASGRYFVQVTSNYSAGVVKDGKFVRGTLREGNFESTEDASIDALEQRLIEVL